MNRLFLKPGRLEKAHELLEKGLAEDLSEGWLGASTSYHWALRKEAGLQPLKSAVARTIGWFEENNLPWKTRCRLYLAFEMRESGTTDGLQEIMEACRKTTEERLKAQFLCPCSWFNLVLFATLDGRIDDAVTHSREWLDNGDSFAMLHTDPIMQTWSDRPEYQEILERNQEQVERQQRLYRAGVQARESARTAP